MSKLLIVIPAHNEEANIVQVVEELTRGYPQYDYVVVNDGSRDKTAALCRAHGYRLIDLPVNLGLAGAFQTGLRFAAENGYDCAMQMDADGQHKPEYIAPMLAALEEGNDIVIGSRFLTVKKPKTLRMLGSYIISWSIRLTTGRAICDPTSGMRMFNRAMVEEFAQNLLRPRARYDQLPDQKRRDGQGSAGRNGRTSGGPELPDLLAQRAVYGQHDHLDSVDPVVPQARHRDALPRKEPVKCSIKR